MFIKISQWKTVTLKKFDITKPDDFCQLNINGICVIRNRSTSELLKVQRYIESSIEKGLPIIDISSFIEKYNID